METKSEKQWGREQDRTPLTPYRREQEQCKWTTSDTQLNFQGNANLRACFYSFFFSARGGYNGSLNAWNLEQSAHLVCYRPHWGRFFFAVINLSHQLDTCTQWQITGFNHHWEMKQHRNWASEPLEFERRESHDGPAQPIQVLWLHQHREYASNWGKQPFITGETHILHTRNSPV